jgi:uncharacterized protein YciI
MEFHIQLIDNPATPEQREASRADHWQYFDDHADNFIARGATMSDDMQTFLSSVIYVDFPDWEAVQSFIDNEPHNKNNVYHSIDIRRWGNPLKKRQRDFPREDGQMYWYIRGIGKPGTNEKRNELLQAHRDYFHPYDDEHFIVRGALYNEDGSEWRGSANLIALPSREAVDEFVANEPYYVNGLYETLIVERYKFGGRPGQVV